MKPILQQQKRETQSGQIKLLFTTRSGNEGANRLTEVAGAAGRSGYYWELVICW